MKIKKVYTTAMGKKIDIHQLGLINEKAIALGNANLNARGDQIDSRGNVIKKREELAQEYYRANPKAVRDNIEIAEDTVVPTAPAAPTMNAGRPDVAPAVTEPTAEVRSASGENFDDEPTRKARRR